MAKYKSFESIPHPWVSDPNYGRRYYETPSFRKLNAEWRKELYESGFGDIETTGEDGPLRNDAADCFEVFVPDDPEALDVLVQESVDADILGAAWGIQDRARAALDDPTIWEGLPELARRWWGLQVLIGWSPDRARIHLGIGSWHKATRLKREIMKRISAKNLTPQETE